MIRVMKEDDETIEKLSRSFVKISEAVFTIKSSTDTLVTIELLSGTEFKFGHRGYATVSDVVPGTLILFRKSGEGCILERQITTLKDSRASNEEIIKKQFEMMFFFDKEEPGTFALYLVHKDFSIDKTKDYSKKETNK